MLVVRAEEGQGGSAGGGPQSRARGKHLQSFEGLTRLPSDGVRGF